MADVLDMIPLKAESPEAYMDKNRHIELKDTAFYYFLNISDFRVAGEQEPYEFAQPKVKDMLVNIKRVERRSVRACSKKKEDYKLLNTQNEEVCEL